LNFINAFAFKSNHITDINNLPVLNARFVVNFNFTDITFIFHHGFTPADSRNLRTDLTAPLFGTVQN